MYLEKVKLVILVHLLYLVFNLVTHHNLKQTRDFRITLIQLQIPRFHSLGVKSRALTPSSVPVGRHPVNTVKNLFQHHGERVDLCLKRLIREMQVCECC